MEYAADVLGAERAVDPVTVDPAERGLNVVGMPPERFLNLAPIHAWLPAQTRFRQPATVGSTTRRRYFELEDLPHHPEGPGAEG